MGACKQTKIKTLWKEKLLKIHRWLRQPAGGGHRRGLAAAELERGGSGFRVE